MAYLTNILLTKFLLQHFNRHLNAFLVELSKRITVSVIIMTIDKLLEECESAYNVRDFERLIELSREVLKNDPDNQIAIGYMAISYCFSNRPKKALEILKPAVDLYPDNRYFKNISAMAYYDLGEYEKSLGCCEAGLKIRDWGELCENKIKALLMLDRVDEAFDFYENSPYSIEIVDLLIECGKYSKAFEYCLEWDIDEYESIIDKIKENDPGAVGDFYLSWIYAIKSRSNIRVCAECGGELVPIVWGLPGPKLLEREDNGEIFLGGCCIPPNPPNYHCRRCGGEFDLGAEGLHIECMQYRLHDYIEYKIRQLTCALKGDSIVFIRSLDSLKKELKGFDDEEFDAFITRLKDLGHIYEPREGHIKLVGWDDFKCAKECPDEGKFAAPLWLVYPQLPPWSLEWEIGIAEHYAKNHPHRSKEYDELFPMPKYWKFKFSESPYGSHPPIGYFWTGDGKPKYPNASGGIEVNGFIAMRDVKKFESNPFRFQSISQAEIFSKSKYFKRRNGDFTPEEEKTWETFRYSVLLNASYFKVMADEDLKRKLLETGDEALIYVSDDEDNLFGRALMELRDEIRRLCENEDLIDWQYTEYLKHNARW